PPLDVPLDVGPELALEPEVRPEELAPDAVEPPVELGLDPVEPRTTVPLGPQAPAPTTSTPRRLRRKAVGLTHSGAHRFNRGTRATAGGSVQRVEIAGPWPRSRANDTPER